MRQRRRLQALAAAARSAGRECWCSPLARTAPVPGGATVPGGRLLWADADTPDAVDRARELCRMLPVRLVVESAGARDPAQPRCTSTCWSTDGWTPTSSRRPTPRSPPGWALPVSATAPADAAARDAQPQERRPGRWCRILACDLHAPGVDLPLVVGKLRVRRAARPTTRAPGAATPLPGALAPRDWFAVLEPDRPITRFGDARCPLHEEQSRR